MAKTKRGPRTKPRNYEIGGGIMRFSSARMYKKRGVYKLKNKKAGKKTDAERKKKETRMITKEVGGEKNGKTRTVRIHRMPRSVPTEEMPRKLPTRKLPADKQKTPKLRGSIQPGQILIMVAGRHKGKRVVFLKQLKSGLLLVTGPYHLNGCPLRRINQMYVIATKTRLDISKVELPERLNDEYFKRRNLRGPKHGEGEIFETKKEVYSVSDVRKEDQVTVDKKVLEAIRARDDKKLLFAYLGAQFQLRSHQFPHLMVF